MKNLKFCVTMGLKSEGRSLIDKVVRKCVATKTSFEVTYKVFDIVEMSIFFPKEVEMYRDTEAVCFKWDGIMLVVPNEAIEMLTAENCHLSNTDM